MRYFAYLLSSPILHAEHGQVVELLRGADEGVNRGADVLEQLPGARAQYDEVKPSPGPHGMLTPGLGDPEHVFLFGNGL